VRNAEGKPQEQSPDWEKKMRRRFLIAGGAALIAAGAAVFAATSANFIHHPVEMDQGGSGAASATRQQYASVGGMALGGVSGSQNYLNSSAFIPCLLPGTATRPIPLLVSAGPANPPDTNELASAGSVPVLQVSLTAGPGADVEIQSVTLSAAGSGDDTAAVGAVRLLLDANGDGASDAGDTLLASAASGFPSDDGALAFTSLTRRISAGGTETWLFEIDFTGTPPPAATFRAGVAANSDVSAVNPADLGAVTPSGAPVWGGTKTIAGASSPGSLRLFTIHRPLDSVAPFPGEKNVEVFPFGLGASSVEAVGVSKIRFQGTGTGDEQLGVGAVRLYFDADRDGKLGAGDSEIGASAYPADNSAVEFAGLGQTVSAGSSLRLLLVYDLSSSVLGGHSFGARVSRGADVTAAGSVSGQPILPAGAPIGAMFTVQAPIAPPPEKREGCGCAPDAESAGPGHLPAFLVLVLGLILVRSLRRGGSTPGRP
jgi:MYXO-CTERM domain-containing protein